jgi:hypothetical protein
VGTVGGLQNLTERESHEKENQNRYHYYQEWRGGSAARAGRRASLRAGRSLPERGNGRNLHDGNVLSGKGEPMKIIFARVAIVFCFLVLTGLVDEMRSIRNQKD